MILLSIKQLQIIPGVGHFNQVFRSSKQQKQKGNNNVFNMYNKPPNLLRKNYTARKMAIIKRVSSWGRAME